METIKISTCHGVEVIGQDVNKSGYFVDICKKCKKPCSVKRVCEECLGTGVTYEDESDGEGHTTKGTKSRTCPFCVGELLEELTPF